MKSSKFLREIFLDGLKACSPSRAVKNTMRVDKEVLIINDDLQFNLKDRPVYLLAVGKASVPMYEAAAEIMGDNIADSLVITSDEEQAKKCSSSEVIVGSHPVPDENSLEAGQRAVSFFEEIPQQSLVLNLLSGGTSSLLCLPPEEVSIQELSLVFDLLNNSGATISEINTVRKHCSQIKGGQLLYWLDSSTILVDLVISDVPNDDLSIIGSGPTTPDLSTFQDAYHILLEYELWDKVPSSVRHHIERGIDGEVMETLRPDDNPLDEHHSKIISSARKLAQNISSLAESRGCRTKIAEEAYNDNVVKIADKIEKKMSEYSTNTMINERSTLYLFIFYGESTVNVTGDGKGGRNQELALRAAFKISGSKNVTWLCAGTDGIDGPTDAAGAIVDGCTISKARSRSIDPQHYLDKNNSYAFHQQLGTHLKTGPTGNNLMDVVLILVDTG